MKYVVVAVVFALALVVPVQAEGVSVFGPRNGPHPRVAALAAERNAAAASGDIELARDIERRIQAVYQDLHPLGSVNHRYETGQGRGTLPRGDAPDVLIDTFRFLATAADYELDGTMWATGFGQQDTAAHLYVSRDHGESWEEETWWATVPRLPMTPLTCVVGEGESLFVYCFFIDPRGAGGDLMCMRWDPRLQSMEFPAVLAGPDTVTDFAVCRDHRGADYWLYAIATNELGAPSDTNDHLLRSTDFGKTWARIWTLRYVRNPHISSSAGSWLFFSCELGPEYQGQHNVGASSWYWSQDSMWWETNFQTDTFEVHDVVVAPAFTVPADSATLWMLYAENRQNSGDWNIKYCWTPSYLPQWSDTIVLAGHPDYDEYFPDIRNYTFAGNAWMNACYITEGAQYRAVQRRHVHAATPMQWSDPLNINTTSAGTGSDVKPKLCYSPGAPGTGAGVVFTGEGLMSLYWNAPWHVGAVEERAKHQGWSAAYTICRGTLVLSGGKGAVLFDVSGREVMKLGPGENNISRMATGVYQLLDPTTGASRRVTIQH